MNKWMKKLTAALCAAVLMCGMAVTAYAGGGEEWDGLDPVEPPPMETVDPGEGFTEDGNLVTRDLLYWHGIGCMFCYREQLKPKTGGKHEP